MNSPTGSRPLSGAENLVWSSAKIVAWLVTVVILLGLVLEPDLTLKVAWFAVVPILPASFLINAGLWRGVCPIATANMIGSPPEGRALSNGWLGTSAAIGIVLLFVLVPARRLILNQNGLVLAITLVAIVAVAFILGRVFRTKAGFCNSLCPILPVEKLYGQSPLLWVRNSRCIPCNNCTQRGCMDLDQHKAVAGKEWSGDGRQWLRSPFGLFAAAFPGFIFGYFQTEDTQLADWAAVYLEVLWPTLVSLLILGGVVFLFNLKPGTVLPFLGALAIGIYYWFAGPASAVAFGLSDGIGIAIRSVALVLVGVWLIQAVRQDRRRAFA